MWQTDLTRLDWLSGGQNGRKVVDGKVGRAPDKKANEWQTLEGWQSKGLADI